MTILVAEDEIMMRKTIEFRLNKDGHTVITASDGRDALQKIEEVEFNLVITDLMMPFASGLEIISAVKKKAMRIPVIVLSAMGQENTVLEAFQLGADDYMTKPFSPNELSMRVKRFATEPLKATLENT